MTAVIPPPVAPRQSRAMRLDPYRVLFPIGVACALCGALLWPIHAAGWIPYPGPAHRALMIQGFETSFVAGFVLTALSGLTHGGRFHPAELALAIAGVALFGVGAAAGAMAIAQAGFLLTVLVLITASGRRSAPGRGGPPEEIVFILLGLAQGLTGGAMLLGQAAGWWNEPAPGLGLRLVSLGMVLSLVIGVGSLLVPTFIGVRDPLSLPRIASPHERRGRRAFYLAVALLLAASFVAEGLLHRALAAWLRALAATPMLFLAWKLHRRPGRRALHAYVLWSAGWGVLAGLWLTALWPSHLLAGEHIVFIAGFGLLTMGIATRVVTVHGGHALALERRVLGVPPLALLALALASRLGAEFAPARTTPLLAASGALWALAWLAWAYPAVPLMLATRPAAQPVPAPLQIEKPAAR